MHLEILNREQVDLLDFIKKYARQYYLVGGTAIALHIGHRKSMDYDLFTEGKVNTLAIKKQVSAAGFRTRIINQQADQIHFLINGVKVTFFQFPFTLPAAVFHKKYFRMPDLPTLAAMKAFALGGRGKCLPAGQAGKDYVDMYFLIKFHLSTTEICNRATALFPNVFSPVLFYKQLCYFADINYNEQVEFMPGFEVSEDEVKDFLTDAALTGF